MNKTLNSNMSNISEVSEKYYTISVNTMYMYMAFIKLLLSTGMSFIISFERELHTHPGGICTHTLVGFGSCLFTMISVHLRDKYPSYNADPARICAQIVSGMGFLGSATIFRSNNYVKGINTAANLWISAAISMAIGADLWELSIITSIFVIIVLVVNNCYKKYRYGKMKKKQTTETEHNTQIDIELSRDPLDAPYGDENELKTD
jgi:putative Mg2+ transporter-C (MgtC) family protein